MYESAVTAVEALKVRGMTCATCESLTGGLICAARVDVPGASAVVRGGLITYQTDTKTLLAGVDTALIAKVGVVSADVAQAMAEGTRLRLGVDVAVSATGMASPGEAEDPPAGTVFLGIASAKGVRSVALTLAGNRAEIRHQTVERALTEIMVEATPPL